jgi:hypothetical protein
VTVTVPLVAVLGVAVFMAYRYLGLRAWHAVLCLLCGFLLAATTAAPGIRHMLAAALQWLTGHLSSPPTEGVDAQVPYQPLAERPDLQEAISRNDHARRIVTGFSRATPALADLWQHIDHSLSDVPVLIAVITRMDGQLRAVRLDRANLAAAGRATLAASGDGDPDPLSFLRAELAAQGFLEPRGRA